MTYTKPLIATIVISMLLFTMIAAPAHAQGAKKNIITQMTDSIKGFDLVSGGENPEQKTQQIVGRVIGAFLSVFGIIFLGLMIYGGYKWMMASGREEEITTAKSTIRSAIIGLIIVLAAYAITFFIAQALQTATS